jgi:hypothetical protein
MHDKLKLSAALLTLLALPAGAKTIQIPVSCVISGKVEPSLKDQICSEILSTLSQSYPEHTFLDGAAGVPQSLTVFIHHATKTGLGLQLKWYSVSGQTREGQVMSVTSMDTNLTISRRQSLYLRLLAATPMPKSN